MIKEQVLVLPKKTLFGPNYEDIFNGIISDPPNPIQEDRGYLSLRVMYQRYKFAFEAGKENNSLFLNRKTGDSKNEKPENLVQLIAYSTFVTKEDEKLYIFSSEISKQSDDILKAEKLGGLINIFWGGHVTDQRYNEWTKNGTIPNPFLLVQDTHVRELAEEVRIDDHYTLVRHLGWIYLPQEKDGISPYHIGHINIVKMPSKKSLVTIYDKEKSLNPSWMLLEEIAQSQRQAPWVRYTIPIIGFMNQKSLL